MSQEISSDSKPENIIDSADSEPAIVPEVMPEADLGIDPKVAPNAAQWLGEIKSLQQQVTESREQRDSAYTSADTLRSLYESETRQRQREAEESKRAIARLSKELTELKADPTEGSKSAGNFAVDIASIRSVRSVDQLQAQLISARQQCEQLKAQLKEEAENHAQTRESLTAALGDAVDLLAKGRR